MENTEKADKGWRARRDHCLHSRQLGSEMLPDSTQEVSSPYLKGAPLALAQVSGSAFLLLSFPLSLISLSFFFFIPNQNKMLHSLVYHSDSGQENILKSQKVLQDGKTISQTGLAMSSRTFKQL